jgi:acetyl-CoA synthetase
VVGRPDDTTGEAICAFVVLKRPRPTGDEAKAIAKQLRDWVGKEIGPIAKPKDIRFGENLPKTRSGKIMRRLLRSLAKGEAITQDTSTLENPAILDQLGKGTVKGRTRRSVERHVDVQGKASDARASGAGGNCER